jgi:tetratricopeptide (TPR) repeat protein
VDSISIKNNNNTWHLLFLLLGLLVLNVTPGASEMKTMPDNAELLRVADKTFNARNYAEATELFEQLAEKAEGDGDTVTLVEALAIAARGHLIRGEKEQGRPWIERARGLANADDPPGWSRYLGVRGRFESYDKEDVKASQTFVDMYEYCMKHQLYSRAIDAAHMVALTGTNEEQVDWANKGIKAAEEGGNEGWLGPLWNNLGGTYWNMATEAEPETAREYNLQAVDCYKKARIYHRKTGDEFARTVADWALGSAYRRVGSLDEAEELIQPVLIWAERRFDADASVENGEWVGLANMDLGLISVGKGDLDLARQQLNIAKEKLSAANMQEWDERAWTLLVSEIEKLGSL